MHYTIADVVSQFKREWTKCLAPEEIKQLCKEERLCFRERLLTPAVTIQLMLLQVLHGNTAISHLPHLAQMSFWPSSFSRARMRIPVYFLEALLDSDRPTDILNIFVNLYCLGSIGYFFSFEALLAKL
jgi:hypothetical protein